MPLWNNLKTERIAIYFDVISGALISGFSIFCIIFATITQGIKNFSISYVLGLGFWVFWLGFSIFLVLLGIKSYYNEKYFELSGEQKKPKKLRAPILS